MQRDDACTCKSSTTVRCKASWRWPNLAVQRDDPCNFKIGTTARYKALCLWKSCGAARRCLHCKTSRTARCKVPCLRKILRCSMTMLAPVRLARLRGAMHRGGDQTLQCSATTEGDYNLNQCTGVWFKTSDGGAASSRSLSTFEPLAPLALPRQPRFVGSCIL